MNRMFGIGSGFGDLSRIWWIVGTAEYQLALYLMKSGQNSDAEKRGGTITDPPAYSGARNAAINPCTWKRGITRYVRSDGVSWYVSWIFPISYHIFLELVFVLSFSQFFFFFFF